MLIYKLFKGTAFVRNKEEETAPNNKKKTKTSIYNYVDGLSPPLLHKRECLSPLTTGQMNLHKKI